MEWSKDSELKKLAKSKRIIDVAYALGMDLVKSGRNYTWKSHQGSFIISPEKNIFSWFSQGTDMRGKDSIALVQLIKGCSFKEALEFIAESKASVFKETAQAQKEFEYNLPEHSNFYFARQYLKEERGLSDDTIDFFLRQNVMALATNKNYQDGFTEPVIVFKNFDINGKMVGGARQGIFYNKRRHPEKGRMKRTLFRSDGTSGTWVDIGTKQQFKCSTPENPFKLIVFEAPIDMMSYYELHKEQLDNCRLVAMHGMNEAIISRNVLEALCLNEQEMNRVKGTESATSFLKKLDELQYSKNLEIVIATDNDSAGHQFFDSINLPHTKVVPHFAPLREGSLKADWNDQLKQVKASQKSVEPELAKSVSPEANRSKFPSIAELEM